MRGRTKLALIAALVSVGALSAFAIHPHGDRKAQIIAHIDEALDAAKATPAQRSAIDSARDHVFAAFGDLYRVRRGEIDEALQLFQADRLDAQALSAHRTRRIADARKVGDAIVQAVYDAHDALTAPQRQAVANYLRGLIHPRGPIDGTKQRFVRHMIQNRIDDALADVNATPDQQAKVTGAADKVIAALHDAHQDHGADVEKLLQLFVADKIDAAQLTALRAEHQAKLDKLFDAGLQAFTDVHDALDAGQRKALVEWVRQHHHHRHG
jgi:hypothetical protein